MALRAAERLGDEALKALIYEVAVNPKPGLVDPVGSGPHRDMDMFTFIDSAVRLRPYFVRCAALGASEETDDSALFGVLRAVGIDAERTMLSATGGINTHKGAVFSLGILVAATARAQMRATDVRATIRQMLAGMTKHDFEGVAEKPPALLTAGERQFMRLGVTGARGEAEAGFPSVFEHGLPALTAARGTRNERLLDTLMAIVACGSDSCLLSRAGDDPAVLDWARAQALSVLEAGGASTTAGMAELKRMNARFLERDLSLGGSADMLILTIFLGLHRGLLER